MGDDTMEMLYPDARERRIRDLEAEVASLQGQLVHGRQIESRLQAEVEQLRKAYSDVAAQRNSLAECFPLLAAASMTEHDLLREWVDVPLHVPDVMRDLTDRTRAVLVEHDKAVQGCEAQPDDGQEHGDGLRVP